MRNSRKTRVLNCVCVALVLLSGVARLVMQDVEAVSCNSLICTLFTAAAVIWISQLQRRLLRTETRRNLIAVGIFAILWMMLRTVKYLFTPYSSAAERYCWYLYYLPQTFILLPMLYSALQIGRAPDQQLDRRWRLLYLPATALVLGILTNDLHQLAFRFPEGRPWTDSAYEHGVLYYASIIWMALLFIVIVVVALRRCAVHANRKKLWMPLAPLAFGLFCFLSFFIWDNGGFLSVFRVPEIICFTDCAFMECLILAGLLPSNDSYDDLWNASSIGAGIMASSGEMRRSAMQTITVSPAQVRQAERGEVLLQDGNVSLRSHKIHGGYGFWTKDTSEITRLNRELAELGDVLAEENAMLDAENRLAEERARMEQQSRLYDGVAQSVKPQLDRISELLDNVPREERAFERSMKYACILNAYVKRRSNLLLLQHQNNKIDGRELCLAISESMEYLRLYGVDTHAEFCAQGSVSGEKLLAAYAVFEAALEAALPDVDAVIVALTISEGTLTLRMELNAPSRLLTREEAEKSLGLPQTTVRVEAEDTTEYLTLAIPAGGEDV